MRVPPLPDLLFVGAQAVCFVALTFAPEAWTFRIPGVIRVLAYVACAASVGYGVLAVLQLGTNLTPWPSPRAGSRLVTGGVYARARHPIYTALIAFACALALATGSGWRLVVAGVLYLLFRGKARYEERLLAARYPDYPAYAARVERFGW